MTACLAANNSVNADIFEEHITMACDIAEPLNWITASRDEAPPTEYLQRLKRGTSGKEKLTDMTALREMVNNSFVQ